MPPERGSDLRHGGSHWSSVQGQPAMSPSRQLADRRFTYHHTWMPDVGAAGPPRSQLPTSSMQLPPNLMRSLNRRCTMTMRQWRLLRACLGVLLSARAASAATNTTQGHTGDSAHHPSRRKCLNMASYPVSVTYAADADQ